MKTLCPKCWKKQKVEMNFCPRCKVRLVEGDSGKLTKKEALQIEKKVKQAKLHELETEDKFMEDVKDRLLMQTRWLTYLMIGLFVIFFVIIIVYFVVK